MLDLKADIPGANIYKNILSVTFEFEIKFDLSHTFSIH